MTDHYATCRRMERLIGTKAYNRVGQYQQTEISGDPTPENSTLIAEIETNLETEKTTIKRVINNKASNSKK